MEHEKVVTVVLAASVLHFLRTECANEHSLAGRFHSEDLEVENVSER